MGLVVKFSVLTLLAFLAGCSSNSSDSGSPIAGTVTDTGNTVSARVYGQVTRSDGEAADGALVRMSRVALPGDSVQVPDYVQTVTDSAGVFAFDSASTLGDTFQLAVIDSLHSEISYLPRTNAGSAELDSIRLSKAAVFNGLLYYKESDDSLIDVGSHFKVFIPGTPFFQSVFAGDSFHFMIPAGEWWFTFCPGDPQIVARLEGSGVPDSLIYRTWFMESPVNAGDTVVAGPFVWSPDSSTALDSIIRDKEIEEKIVSRISGRVFCDSACAGVEVQVITDLYGFGFTEGDSASFVAQTVTDSTGRWYMPVPEVPYDSFRVEYRLLSKDSSVLKGGFSRYVLKSEVQDLEDTLDLGRDSLVPMSSLVSGVFLVIDQMDSNQSNNCMVNSVVVGIKGSAHFVREVTCNMLKVNELPSGSQEIVLYSGDMKVIRTLQEANTPLEQYVVFTSVELPEGEPLDQQWMTYTPPTSAK